MILGEEIGRGGFGTVYELKDDKSKAVKISSKDSGTNCRKWSDEFAKINDICMHKMPKLKYVSILQPDEFIEKEGLCYMILPRIFRHDCKIKNVTSATSPQSCKNNPTIHPLLGQQEGKMIFKGRGEFIGFKEVSEIVGPQYDLMNVCYELGIMMASIHFIGKNDAYDIEVFLGRKYRDKNLRFYIADFDLSEKVPDDISEDIIERLKWSIEAVPYFPNEFVDMKYFEQFKKGYHSVISKLEGYKNNLLPIYDEIFS